MLFFQLRTSIIKQMHGEKKEKSKNYSYKTISIAFTSLKLFLNMNVLKFKMKVIREHLIRLLLVDGDESFGSSFCFYVVDLILVFKLVLQKNHDAQ